MLQRRHLMFTKGHDGTQERKKKTKQAYDQQRNYLTANREQGTLTKVKSHRFILGKL